MGKQKLRSKDLQRVGFECNESISISLNIIKKHYKKMSVSDQIALIKKVKENVELYRDDPVWGALVTKLKPRIKRVKCTDYDLATVAKPYKVYGKRWIDQKAIDQMEMAMKLPVSVEGALMPDAHVGYGLPIGGVLATDNAVIPYAVGLDIGCRMALTIFDADAAYAKRIQYQMKHSINEQTYFGNKLKSATGADHEVLEDPRFGLTPLLRKLQGKAIYQIGSSGSGNHFVEWGEVTLETNNRFGIPEGTYIGLLTHSGSRGVGATIAQYYTELAMERSRLQKGAKALAWLDLHTQEGQEYWLSMNLAGDFAKACHDVIHNTLAKSVGLKPLTKIENHHNFAWKEQQLDGSEQIVHRKGATPAQKGVLGLIPSSMASTCYLVEGLGESASLNSASHGAGRRFSRGEAKSTFKMNEVKKELKKAGVELIGGGADEAPQAYKDIEQVMASQKNLVHVVGRFQPRIVKMAK